MAFPLLTSSRTRPRRPAHLLLGEKGEKIAATYLRSIGYIVRECNVKVDRDEIDILAYDPEDDVLVFAEIKTRTEKTKEGFHPELRAGKRKRIALKRAARRWVARREYDGGYRIDLICVEEGRVTSHFKELSW